MRRALAAGTVRTLGVSVAIAGVLATAGCATGADRHPGDPLEPMNRAIFGFNDGVDKYVARPVAQAYVNVTPSPLRTAVSNFFSNLGDIGNFANNLLQLKITDATEDFVRFAFNSTFGMGGLIDIASQAGLPKHHQDFGLTLGHYGVPSGPYLVLPIFGPSSFRDATNWLVAFRLDPVTYLDPLPRNLLFGLNFVSARADLIGATDILSQAALDKYAFVRDAYTQRRQYLLTGGGSATLPDYGDDTGAAAPEGASATAAPGASGGGSKAQGLPTYEDPGAAAPSTKPSTGSSSGSGADVPQYEDPGATPAAK
ncbi:MlaA family lipoprotein [Caballeronia telluris]|uniref:Lipoprotein VacJ n=1 Tax=Caballeronia telluris TaxID=326475 RepID=A0A158ENG2_9BURK|nr:VacJ family lipoprotein [Caballeronia telluris]SAL09114.1 lipoprotein VacJ [Caballeronia telluris]